MKLSGKYQALWILFWISISITESLADVADAADNMSRSRFHGPSSEMNCIYGPQQSARRRRSECRRQTPKKVKNGQEEINLTFPGCGKRSPDVPLRTSTTRKGGLRQRKKDVASQFRRTRFRRFDLLHRPVIVGGTKTESNSWPWMVAVFKKKSKGKEKFICGASLISRRYVLSAAHCFDKGKGKTDPSKFHIVVGSRTTHDGIEYPLSNVLIHPDYQQRKHYNDISILDLGKDVQLTEKVYPVCLPSVGLRDKYSLYANNVTVTGWGDTSVDGKESHSLREVSMPLVPTKNCNASYASLEGFSRGIDNHFLCAGLKKGGKDSCQGDSGGPLVNELEDNIFVQLGIVSFGHGCAEPYTPGVYTRVSRYIKWLHDNTDLGH